MLCSHLGSGKRGATGPEPAGAPRFPEDGGSSLEGGAGIVAALGSVRLISFWETAEHIGVENMDYAAKQTCFSVLNLPLAVARLWAYQLATAV